MWIWDLDEIFVRIKVTPSSPLSALSRKLCKNFKKFFYWDSTVGFHFYPIFCGRNRITKRTSIRS
jgi:hypothetical protein